MRVNKAALAAIVSLVSWVSVCIGYYSKNGLDSTTLIVSGMFIGMCITLYTRWKYIIDTMTIMLTVKKWIDELREEFKIGQRNDD